MKLHFLSHTRACKGLIIIIASLWFVHGAPILAATLYFYPQNISLIPGEEALLEIRIDTGGERINAVEVEGVISGVAATLRSLDNSGSALSIFVERPAITGRSVFRIVGGAPSGIIGEQILARLVVRGELAGSAILSFDTLKTQVLLADGAGGVASLQTHKANISVRRADVGDLILNSESHPDQNQWYAKSTAHIRFNWSTDEQYSYVLTYNPLEAPDEIADTPEGNATWDGGVKLSPLPEGVSYFAIKKIGSHSVARYRLMTDNTKPRWLEIRKSEGIEETEGRPFLSFLAKDDISGIDRYEMRIDRETPFIVASPFPMPAEYRVILLRAYDRAGNYIEEYIPGPQKDYALWVWACILFVLLIWVSGIIDIGKRK